MLMNMFVVKKLRRSRVILWIRKHLVCAALNAFVQKISELGANRLVIFRTPRHIYAQLIAPTGSEVIASASTLDKEVKAQVEKKQVMLQQQLQ